MLCQFLLYSRVNQPYAYIHPLFFRFPSTALSSLCYTVGSHWLSILYIVVCMCQSQSPNSSHPPLPCLVTISLFSTSVTLFLHCKEVHLYHSVKAFCSSTFQRVGKGDLIATAVFSFKAHAGSSCVHFGLRSSKLRFRRSLETECHIQTWALIPS